MIWRGVSIEGHKDLHLLANSTLTEVLRPTVRPYTGVEGPGFQLVQIDTNFKWSWCVSSSLMKVPQLKTSWTLWISAWNVTKSCHTLSWSSLGGDPLIPTSTASSGACRDIVGKHVEAMQTNESHYCKSWISLQFLALTFDVISKGWRF